MELSKKTTILLPPDLHEHPTRAAVALQHTGGEIRSFDGDFDEIDGLRRIEPH